MGTYPHNYFNSHWNKINPVKACNACDKLIFNKVDQWNAGDNVYYHTSCMPSDAFDSHDCTNSPEDGCNTCTEYYSEDYPLSGSIEPYDIHIEMELTN